MQDRTVYGIITERIISLLEQGTIPWHKPWQGGDCLPQNLVSRKPYRGVNVFLLHAMAYQSPFWLTYKQAQALGGQVRRGEKSCPVVFWKWLDVADQTQPEQTKRLPMLRYYAVFNVAQCDGLTVPSLNPVSRAHNPVESAESILMAMPLRPKIKDCQAAAYYRPSTDEVGMPAFGSFERAEDYYSTLFHELTHSTGHESRLNRKGVSGGDGQWSAFGSTPYAKEELVAEMGAAFLSGQAGILHRTLNNSASYVAGWLSRLKEDPKLVVMAAAQAQKAADFILGHKSSEGTGEA